MRIERTIAVALARPRGVYMPVDEVEACLANGWRVLDDCPGSDEVLMAPPPALEEAA